MPFFAARSIFFAFYGPECEVNDVTYFQLLPFLVGDFGTFNFGGSGAPGGIQFRDKLSVLIAQLCQR